MKPVPNSPIFQSKGHAERLRVHSMTFHVSQRSRGHGLCFELPVTSRRADLSLASVDEGKIVKSKSPFPSQVESQDERAFLFLSKRFELSKIYGTVRCRQKSGKQSKSAKSSQEEQQRAVSLNVENRVLPYRDKEGCTFLYNSRLENTPSVNKTLTSHWTFSDSVAIFLEANLRVVPPQCSRSSRLCLPMLTPMPRPHQRPECSRPSGTPQHHVNLWLGQVSKPSGLEASEIVGSVCPGLQPHQARDANKGQRK